MNPTEVAHGALINIVQKGLLYLDIEREVKGGQKVRRTHGHTRLLARSIDSSWAWRCVFCLVEAIWPWSLRIMLTRRCVLNRGK